MKNIAIIGSGPRGLAVLERLTIELSKKKISEKIKVYIFDKDEIGCGRIWQTKQSDSFLMNTNASHVTMYSKILENDPIVFEEQPTLSQWVGKNKEFSSFKNEDYLPRKIYGEYLKSFYQKVVAKLSKYAKVINIQEEVIDIEKKENSFVLYTRQNSTIKSISSIVLALGHEKVRLNDPELIQDKLKFINCLDHYIQGDSAQNMNLDVISSYNTVFIKGLGLSFYDIVMALTEKRGGKFEKRAGKLIYIPSGSEPKIIAGSRSGLPLPARGVNQKYLSYTFSPSFFKETNIKDRLNKKKTKKLLFNEDIMPLLWAEIEHIYYKTSLKNIGKIIESDNFAYEHEKERKPYENMPKSLKLKYELDKFELLNLHILARPFSNMKFESQEEFSKTLIKYLIEDNKEAMKGNISSPIKAALDVIRDLRDRLRENVECGNIDRESFVKEFKEEFIPICSLLTAGPPLSRVEQLIALLEANILEIAGPLVKIEVENMKFTYVTSDVVNGYRQKFDTFIDGILPTPSLKQRDSELIHNLLDNGLVREHTELIEYGISGGIDIVDSTYQVFDKYGVPQNNIFSIGIQNENPKWFTQVGSGTYDKHSSFMNDAKVLVENLLSEYERFNIIDEKNIDVPFIGSSL